MTTLDIRTVSRYTGAVALVLGSAAYAVPITVSGDEDVPSAARLADYAAQPGVARAANLALLLMIAMVPAMVYAARLARPGAPKLAFAGGGIAALAWLTGLMSIGAGQILLYQGSLLPVQDRPAAAALIDGVNRDPVFGALIGIFVIGHLVGMVLLGASLWRSHAVPVWVAALFTASPILHVVGYATYPLIDRASGVAFLVSGVMIALRIVRTPDSRWDLPAGAAGSAALPGSLVPAHNQR